MLKNILLASVALLAMGTAAYAEEIKELRVGIIGGENEADRLRSYACLADHMKTALGVEKVSLFPAADYDGTIQGLLGGTLDVAGLGSSGYAKVFIKDPQCRYPDHHHPGYPTARPATSRLVWPARTPASPTSCPPRARSSATPIRTPPRAI